jgi:hypothetical protein
VSAFEPPSEPRYRGWSAFFGGCVSVVAAWVFAIAAYKTPPGDKLGVVIFGILLLLLGLRLLWAAITGRVPPWLEEIIDNPD